ncbi:hypothetical protein I7I50_00676 [Histoplasma capsulatum G186AR]|uniref:Uncharacterized protein n=1 Tax=Ajellomyces capsulatus TaxID=5037 RepID=A0A8H7YG18_AJECA|nr:hypothetical protein I7I52_07944 [Histoplasma capsulatum]QSS72740.1 hypothetical protein I7I50_00676 [Histoplasma capsulatum G186AR]
MSPAGQANNNAFQQNGSQSGPEVRVMRHAIRPRGGPPKPLSRNHRQFEALCNSQNILPQTKPLLLDGLTICNANRHLLRFRRPALNARIN